MNGSYGGEESVINDNVDSVIVALMALKQKLPI
jgi:hypothetical protein